MRTFAKVLWAGIGLLVILFLGLSSYHSTDSTEVGVRTIKWFGKKGVENHLYQPGSAYFFLGNSYDNLYKPSKKGDAENDALLTKAVNNYQRGAEKLFSIQRAVLKGVLED